MRPLACGAVSGSGTPCPQARWPRRAQDGQAQAPERNLKPLVVISALNDRESQPLERTFDIGQAMALSRRSVGSRLGFAACFALAAAAAIPWQSAALWCVVVLTWELAGRPMTDRAIRNINNADHALRTYAGFKALSAGIYTTLGVMTLASGEELGAIIGAAWLTGSMAHTFVYYASNRLLLIVTMAPTCLGALAGPMAAFGFGFEALIGAGALLSALTGGSVFLLDRKTLLRELDDTRLARAIAEKSSLAKSQFLATMSHELRTPLNAIIGYSELMSEDAEESCRSSDVADHARVLHAARHLLAMINEVLDLSKIEAGRMQIAPDGFDIARLAREVLDSVRPQAEANNDVLGLRFVGDNIGALNSDAFKLKQCLLNLLSNAVKFTRNGAVTLRIWRDGKDLVFEVKDTGIGMERQTLERLFQPFVQADASTTREYGGTGLGLAITRRLAQLLGGDVVAESTPGAGSTFTLTVLADLAGATPDGQPQECALHLTERAA